MSREPRSFSCFDDSPENNGYGYNSELKYREEPEPEETEPDIEGYPDVNTVTVVNRGNIACTNSFETGFNHDFNHSSTIGSKP